jgi:hypothetical protein
MRGVDAPPVAKGFADRCCAGEDSVRNGVTGASFSLPAKAPVMMAEVVIVTRERTTAPESDLLDSSGLTVSRIGAGGAGRE